jgi:hypothetical protein
MVKKKRRPSKPVVSPLELAMTERIRRTIVHLNISQAQLARQIGAILGEHWDQPRVWKLLWNEVPATVRIWEAVAQAVNIDLRDLVGAPRLNVGYTTAVITTEENAVLQRFRTDPLNRAINLSFLDLANMTQRLAVWTPDDLKDGRTMLGAFREAEAAAAQPEKAGSGTVKSA